MLLASLSKNAVGATRQADEVPKQMPIINSSTGWAAAGPGTNLSYRIRNSIRKWELAHNMPKTSAVVVTTRPYHFSMI
jgi:hypothetical protein